MALKYLKPERIMLGLHPDLKERWVQERIAEDPAILGLGDLVLKDKERREPHAGRLDLLLQEQDFPRRYTVEVQLGRTDESHIIRTIEYWDEERKRYPKYDHVAVIVAEDIISRFLNVIGLFNGHIPLIALQMQALRMGDQISLIFTKVLDLVRHEAADEEEEAAELTDRTYWEKKASATTLDVTDKLFNLVREIDGELALKYKALPQNLWVGLATAEARRWIF